MNHFALAAYMAVVGLGLLYSRAIDQSRELLYTMHTMTSFGSTRRRAMLLHGRVMPAYVVCPSVCPSGVTLMYAGHTSEAISKSNFMTRSIRSVSQLFADITLALARKTP